MDRIVWIMYLQTLKQRLIYLTGRIKLINLNKLEF